MSIKNCPTCGGTHFGSTRCPMPAPPFLVQCHRKGQHTTWFTDRRFDVLLDAEQHARQLWAEWGRKVRVIDQAEHVWLRLSP